MRQLFGKIIGEDGNYEAMFCSDTDQPNIATIHWWRQGENSLAITFILIPGSDNKLTLIPKVFYKSDASDGLFAPSLTPDEQSLLRSFSGILTPDGSGGYIGDWEFKGGERGRIFLYGEMPFFKLHKLEAKKCKSWNEFKEWATDLRINVPSCAFRGHGSNAWSLTTTISRAGRIRVERYREETIQLFRMHAEVIMEREFDLSNPNEFATLLGLAQHHGLPTPLLDITDSPYVAAYFAFADAIENKRAPENFVRIYAISGDYLQTSRASTLPLAAGRPYVKPLSISPRHNPRLYVQQGRFLVTNVVDLEAFLLLEGAENSKSILYAADISIECAFDALQDLKYMGLTAGSLFPGLDGVSRMVKQMMMVNDAKRHLELLPQNDIKAILDDSSKNLDAS